MKHTSILDCTLRDGGYINEFEFGQVIMKNLISKLEQASIDIIECGFLQRGKAGRGTSLFGSVEQISELISPKKPDILYVAMIAYGDIPDEMISLWNSDTIDGIRITFHEQDIDGAYELAASLKNKGYKVFIQPVGTMAYSDAQLLRLIEKTNQLEPYAFYLVDTMGTMYQNELRRMFYLVDHNLKESIQFGFHSHNNLQLSFSNAQELLSIHTQRSLIIDSSILGMGRGAGNLCTELIARFINENIMPRYDILALLEAIDECVSPILQEHSWGYASPYYVASINRCHPNYASHLMNKQTVRARDIYQMLSSIPAEKRHLYDKEYIEELYLTYQSHAIDDSACTSKMKELLCGCGILLLAPGYSIKEREAQIKEYMDREKPVVFSVNFLPENLRTDFLFVSNSRRLPALKERLQGGGTALVTSNLLLPPQENIYVLNYSSYLNEEDSISDNAGLMLINFLISLGIKRISLAGFDGFQEQTQNNFYDNALANTIDSAEQQEKNQAIIRYFHRMKHKVEFTFITPSKYWEE